MEVLIFESMRVFKGENGRVIFKLKLPKLGEGGCEEFNSFYSSLASEYAGAAERLSKTAEGDVRFLVSFESEEKNETKGKGRRNKGVSNREGRSHLLIRRLARISIGNNERLCEALDEYNVELDAFVR